MARRYLQQSSFSSFNNITLRNVPKMLMKTDSVKNVFDDLFSNSTLFNSIPTMTSTELYSMVETNLNQVPYDPYGIDAQMSFGKYHHILVIDTIARVSKSQKSLLIPFF
jgi:hypothetical protein